MELSDAIKEQKGVVRLLSSFLVALGVFTGTMIMMIIGVVKNNTAAMESMKTLQGTQFNQIITNQETIIDNQKQFTIKFNDLETECIKANQ